MSSVVRVRPAAPADHAALCGIDTVASADGERRDRIAAWIDAGACRVLEADGLTAAYGVQTRHFFGEAFIEMLMVGRRFRRRGLGLALLAHYRERCTGTKLFSSTNMSNRPMQKCFVKAGFRPSGYIDNLDENDPEIVFFCPVR